MVIRRATQNDLDWIVSRLKDNFSECYDTKRAFFQNDEFTSRFMSILIDTHIVLLAEKNGEPVGFLAGIVHGALYDPALKVLSSALFWVEPKHRRSRAGLKLFDAFRDAGKAVAHWVVFNFPPQAPISDKSMKRRGFRLKERQFVMEVQ